MQVVVVGAGITGLAATHYLRERDVDVVCLEASDEPGGVIRSEAKAGLVLERGPQRMRRTPAVDGLIDTLDLESAAIEANEELPLYVYADGRLGEVPFGGKELLGTDLLSWPGKLRLVAEPLTKAGRPDESIAAVFSRKFGQEAYERMFGPLYGGIYGSDPAEMPARHALASLLEREEETGSLLKAFQQRVGGGRKFPPLSFEDGLQQLPKAMAAHHDDSVHLSTPVTGIAADGAGYVVETADEAFEADHVVVTTPADVTADLLENVADGIDGLRDLTYNRLAMVSLQADLKTEGFGYQVGYGEDLHTLGASWNASMFDRDGLYTVFLGGMHEPDLVDDEDERLGDIAASEFEVVTGASAEVLDVHRLDRGFPAWDYSWDALDDLEVPEGIDLATNYTARMGVPSRIKEGREVAEAISSQSVAVPADD
ncbi:protoporphyrinogen oxidase [Halobacteriales archaeon Cl-PHB]